MVEEKFDFNLNPIVAPIGHENVSVFVDGHSSRSTKLTIAFTSRTETELQRARFEVKHLQNE